MSGIKKSYVRSKGRFVKKNYMERKIQRHLVCDELNQMPKATYTVGVVEEEFTGNVEGRRIVDIAAMAEYLQCLGCKEVLSLLYIESETRRGLVSIFKVRCHHCLVVRDVPTGKYSCKNDDLRLKTYDVNARAVLGKYHSYWCCFNKYD